jgi:hypothetical protein
VGLIPWVMYFIEKNNKKLIVFSVILLLLSQENMGIALICIAFLIIFRKSYFKLSIVFIIIGVIYSLIAAKVVAFFSPVGFQYWPSITLNPINLITQFFDSTEKKQVWLYSLTSFGLLSVFSPGAVIAVIIDLSQYFITGNEFARMWSPFMHHRAILAPFLAYGAMDTALFLSGRVNSKIVAAWLIISAIIFQYAFHNPLNKLVKKEYWQNYSWMDNDRSIISKVPTNAKVAAQQNLVPHLSHRREIYLVWPRKRQTDGNYCGEKFCWWLDFGGKPEYLVVDTRPDQWLTQILESNENWLSAIINMEKAGKIRLVDSAGDARLYEINNRLIQ